MAGGAAPSYAINQAFYLSGPVTSALIVPSDAPDEIKAAAQNSKAVLGALIQILDGVNDNAMFAAALAALPATNIRVTIAQGNVYGLDVDLAAKQYLTISGQGEGVTIIHGVFRCQPVNTQHNYNFEDFSMNGGAAGTAFSMSNLMYVRFENIYLEDYNYCFDMNHTTFDRWLHVDMRNIIIRLFYFYGGGDPILGGNDHYLSQVTYDSDGALRPDGIETAGTGALILNACDFIHCNTGLHINPGAGETSEWFLLEQTYWDLGDGDGILIEGAGVVRGILFDGCWSATNGNVAGDGCRINCALADGIDFSDCHVHNNGGAGYYIQAGNNIKIKGGEVAGNNLLGLNANGIYINAQVEVRGVYIGRMFTWVSDHWDHIYLDAGANALIEDNDLDANYITAAMNLAGVYRIRGNRGFVTENSGVAALVDPANNVVVAHGLDVTPTAEDIQVTPSSTWWNCQQFWVANIGAATFTIWVFPVPGGLNTMDFQWQAIVL